MELLDDGGDLPLLARIGDPGAEDQPPAVVAPVALERVDVHAHERLGRLRRDLLDLDSAARREHE